jgi:hypothetical protein
LREYAAPMREALYEVDGDRFVATDYTRGPWSREHQHAGPPAALLARAVEKAAGIEGGMAVRLAFDILRPVPVAPLTVAVRTLRPGRNVEQLEATLSSEEHEVMRARVWRMARREAAARPPAGESPEAIATGERARFFAAGQVAYYDALDWRFAHGGWNDLGPAMAWTRPQVDLIAGEPITPLEHLLVMGDAASGISNALDQREWMFPNVDFSVLLERLPQGEWIAMDAVTHLGGDGPASCVATYSDQFGRVGTSTQALIITAR